MSVTSELLFTYLRNIFNFTPQAPLDLEMLDGDFVMLGKGLLFFEKCFSEFNEFAQSLGRGDLNVPLPPSVNEMAGPLKSLHASLKHLTWQSQQVAKGDYKQRVDFMGEFAESFNTMVDQLSERQEKLEQEITQSHQYAKSMEQGNVLLSNLIYHIPQQVFVVSAEKQEVLLFNDKAKMEIENEPEYMKQILELFPEFEKKGVSNNIEIQYNHDSDERYLLISSYPIEWEKTSAVAMVITDVSAEKRQMKDLETHAFYDALTGLFNRFYGMLTLNDWLNEKKRFSLVFIDLDNLKFINDKYGHEEGDKYISKVALCLKSFSDSAVVCRIGGDEFMMLIPDSGSEETRIRMDELQNELNTDEYLNDKDYIYSISYGIIAIDEDNELSSSIVLSIADERMYEHKRERKMNRRTSGDS